MLRRRSALLAACLLSCCRVLSAQDNEEVLKVKVAQAVRMLAAEGFVGSSGHVSARAPGTDRVLINSRNGSREVVQAEDIVTVNLDGKKIAGKDLEPEVSIHVSIYRARPDVVSVIHTHNVYSTGFRVAQKEILPVSVHGAIFADGILEYHRAGKVIDRRQGDDLANALGPHRAALMRMHGAVVVGAYLEEAFCAAIQLEENAKMQITASTLGPVSRMTPTESEEAIKESSTLASINKRWDITANVKKHAIEECLKSEVQRNRAGGLARRVRRFAAVA
jgi:L-ribulose-5-phosphate 4-epimerase